VFAEGADLEDAIDAQQVKDQSDDEDADKEHATVSSNDGHAD
jgi:hypothetical protein